jgi:hypothetical protein
MRSSAVSLADLARDPLAVARRLPAWQRGDVDEAAVATLEASARDLHSRAYTCWVWAGRTADGAPAWALPVRAADAAAFSARGPARVLARCLQAAVDAGTLAAAITLEQWRGFTALVLPGLDEELAPAALELAHPSPGRGALARLPDSVLLDGSPLALPALAAGRDGDGDGLAALARAAFVHPVRVALALAEHGQPITEPSYPAELVGALREWGCVGRPPAPRSASLAIEDDPCPRRRHARKVVQRLLRMGKVGSQYHTEFDHLYRGAAPEDRREALEVGEALLRAGLLGEKPSVGQRHVYLRREALPQIHALIERGHTVNPVLAAHWTAPAPEDLPPDP